MIRLLSAIILLLLITACSNESSSDIQPTPVNQQSPAIAVEVQTLAPQQWRGQINTFGVIEAAEEINLSIDFSGVIESLLVDEGQRIQKGQVLIKLDQEKLQLQFNQASEVTKRSKAALDEAFLTLERRQSLAENNTVSQEQLDNAKLAVSRAQAQYREAIAAQQLAKRELTDGQILSPVNGVVDIKHVEAGESIQPGTSLLTLQAVDILRAKTWISEKDINLIRSGGSAQITLSGLPGKTFSGTIESIGVNGHPQTGNFPVKIIVTDASTVIRPGMTASIAIHGLELSDMLILPEQALADRDRKRVVFLAQAIDGKMVAVRKEPLLTAGMGNQLFILSGLEPGDQLIISELGSIIDGSVIIITEPSGRVSGGLSPKVSAKESPVQ